MSMARQKTDGTQTSTRSPRKRSQAKRVSEPVISFSELDGIRYLHFGSPWVVSSFTQYVGYSSFID